MAVAGWLACYVAAYVAGWLCGSLALELSTPGVSGILASETIEVCSKYGSWDLHLSPGGSRSRLKHTTARKGLLWEYHDPLIVRMSRAMIWPSKWDCRLNSTESRLWESALPVYNNSWPGVCTSYGATEGSQRSPCWSRSGREAVHGKSSWSCEMSLGEAIGDPPRKSFEESPWTPGELTGSGREGADLPVGLVLTLAQSSPPGLLPHQSEHWLARHLWGAFPRSLEHAGYKLRCPGGFKLSPCWYTCRESGLRCMSIHWSALDMRGIYRSCLGLRWKSRQYCLQCPVLGPYIGSAPLGALVTLSITLPRVCLEMLLVDTLGLTSFLSFILTLSLTFGIFWCPQLLEEHPLIDPK